MTTRPGQDMKVSHRQEMEFNTKKGSVIGFGRSKRKTSSNYYTLENKSIKKSSMEKDLGGTVLDNLWPEKHLNSFVEETYNQVRNIKVAFQYLDEEMMMK